MPAVPMNDYTPIADLYDLYVTDTGDHPFWTRRAAESEGPILELTAGTGRATVALRAGTSQPVVALDSSPAMLRRLSARLADSPAPVLPVCGDLVELPFPDGGFALCGVPFNSLGEVVEPSARRRALEEIRRVLSPSGRAVVTLHNPARRRLTLDGDTRTLGPFVSGERRLVVEVRGVLTDAAVAASEQTYRLTDRNGALIEERRVTIRFALPGADELRAMADKAGFRVIRLFGDYDESSFVPGDSPFILAVLRPG
jgi:ubiquinone/menaquinone biosynthesis C-methylase UbiE